MNNFIKLKSLIHDKKKKTNRTERKKGIHTTGYKTQYSLCNIFDHSQVGFECVPGLCPEASVALLQPDKNSKQSFFFKFLNYLLKILQSLVRC